MATPLPVFSVYKRPLSNDQDEWLATDAMVLNVLDIVVQPGELISATGIVHKMDSTARQYWVVTSPNMTFIPFVVIGERHVKARSNGLYGFEDRTQHPQYYVDGFQWMCCIPRSVED
ncbi:hypothetical protein BKA70DRAFT_1424217 [Coprinopsis sp. MPI-PUGE-AT-0042]|nr:hypothetical protein BKA70DRAFT_1424217 [Coprinopsis sp. MPI-PUGE-AT-0042]